MESTKADQRKQLGNQEFKKGNYQAAISYYTEAIGKDSPSFYVCSEIAPHETIYSNRAASMIQLKQYKRALDDCKAAIRLNPDFSKIYKRLFKANLGMGNIEEAEQALKQALTLEPNDPANKEDSSLMETVLHQQKMIAKYG
jgi:tetratricopeptide (TPR) repeat protein